MIDNLKSDIFGLLTQKSIKDFIKKTRLPLNQFAKYYLKYKKRYYVDWGYIKIKSYPKIYMYYRES